MADTRGTILVADDDPATVEVLSDYLAGKRLGVARAHSLDEALAELESERPEAVVISLRLGESNGLDAVRRPAPGPDARRPCRRRPARLAG